MGTRDDVQRSEDGAPSSAAGGTRDGVDRLSVEVAADLAVTVDAAVEDEEDEHVDTPGSGVETTDVVVADEDEPPADAPLGLTSVRLPARGRRRGRPGTIF